MESSGRGHRCPECDRVHRALLDHPLTSVTWRRRRARFLAVRRAENLMTCDHCGVDVSGPGQADVQHRTPRRELVAGLAGMGRDLAGARVLGTATLRAAGRTAAAGVADGDLEVLCKPCHGRMTRAEAAHGGVGEDRERIDQPSRRSASPDESSSFPHPCAKREQPVVVEYAEVTTSEHPLLSMKQAAALLGFSLITVRRMIQRGELLALHIGPRAVRIRLEDLEALIAKKR